MCCEKQYNNILIQCNGVVIIVIDNGVING